MRKLLYTIPPLIALLAISSLDLKAQQQKIGYVDTDFILSKMPEYQGLDQQLRQLSQQWRRELDKMQEEIDRLKENYQAKEILYTEEVRKQKQEEIKQKVNQREQYMEEKFGPDGEYFQRQKELLEPIQRRVFQAINKIASQQGFDFVFDKAGNNQLMYSRQEWNLNDEVLIELGIDVNQVSN